METEEIEKQTACLTDMKTSFSSLRRDICDLGKEVSKQCQLSVQQNDDLKTIGENIMYA